MDAAGRGSDGAGEDAETQVDFLGLLPPAIRTDNAETSGLRLSKAHTVVPKPTVT